MKHGKYSKGYKNFCVKCNKRISPLATYCEDCYYETLKGEPFLGANHPNCIKGGNYIDGRSLLIGNCIDCNKKLKSSKALRCPSCSNKINCKNSSRMLGKKHDFQTIEKMKVSNSGENNGFYGKRHSKETIEKILKTQLKRWRENPNFKNKKNKIELKLENILNELFPKEYKFVGNCKFWIERFNPDFINCNGQKKIIELFGDYWHNLPEYKERDKKRLRTYSKYGYKTLVIWEHELRDLEKIKNKIKEFNKIGV